MNKKNLVGVFSRILAVLWSFSLLVSVVGLIFVSIDPTDRLNRVSWILYPSATITVAPLVLVVIFSILSYIIYGSEMKE